jgi:hypothetical protein
MNHKHNATDLFPTWYKSIDPQVQASIVGLRTEAITKLLTINNLSFWLDIVRIAFVIPLENDNSVDTLVKEFKEADVNFPLTSNENLLLVLSQILLAFLFESTNENREITAEAVNNIVFFGQFDTSDIPYYNFACEVLNEDSRAVLEVNEESKKTLLTLKETITENSGEDEAIVLNDADHLAMIESLDILIHQNLRLKEETNVLWWLFGGFSKLQNEYFQIAGVPSMILAAPKELADFGGEQKRFLAAKHFLARVLNLANDSKPFKNEYSISDITGAVEPNLVKNILLGLPTPSELTPCMYALFSSSQFEDATVWKAAFQKKIKNASVDKKFGAIKFAYQLYNEILFLSHLKQ